MTCLVVKFHESEVNFQIVDKIMNNEIFGFTEIDTEVKSEFKYLWDQFPPFIVKDIDVSLLDSKMKK